MSPLIEDIALGPFTIQPTVKVRAMNNAVHLHSLFPTLVQISEITGAQALNRDLERDIYEVMKTTPNSLPEAWSCSVYTTISSGFDLFSYDSFQRLGKIIDDETLRYARSLHYDVDRFPPRITDCWVNVYKTGDAQEAHVHQNNVLSGMYYVKTPKSCGELLFHSTLADVMLDPPKTEIDDFNTDVAVISPVAGQMFLFRSSLRHSVKPNKSTEDRISIAFNLTM